METSTTNCVEGLVIFSVRLRLTAASRRAGANSFADLDTDIQRVHDAAKGRAFNVRAQAKLMPR